MRDYTGTVDRCFVFCKESKKDIASLESVAWDPDTGGGNTFSVPCTSLSGLPTDPPTHYTASSAVDSQMDTDIKGSGATVTKYFELDGYTFESALQDMWLQLCTE